MCYGVDLKRSHQRTSCINTVELLANAMVIIILQYISVSGQHTEHLKLTWCYMSVIHLDRKKRCIKKAFQWEN